MDVVDIIRNGYGEYPTKALVLIGLNALILSFILAAVFAFYPWRRKPEDIIHRPEEDKLWA
jgi:hypothetical protein